jgi:hypothetical protein
MIGVYTMPNLFKVSGVLTILVAGAIAFWGVSRAQINVLERMPVKQCKNPEQNFVFPPDQSGNDNLMAACDGGLWISVEDFQRTLEPMGVKFKRDTEKVQMTTIQNPTPQEAIIKQLVLDFPDFSQVRIPYHNEMAFPTANGKLEKIAFTGDFIFAANIIGSMKQLGGTITMAGWDNPGIRYGGVRFTIGTKERPVLGHKIYPALLFSSLYKQFFNWTKILHLSDAPNVWEERAAKYGFEALWRDHKHKIQTKLPQGRILVVVSLEEAQKIVFQGKTIDIPAGFRTFLIPVGADGIIEYPSAAKTLRFSSQLQDLKSSAKNQVGNVVIMRFTGNLGHARKEFEIIPAENFSK